MKKQVIVIGAMLAAGVAVAAVIIGMPSGDEMPGEFANSGFNEAASLEERVQVLELAVSAEREARQLLEDELFILYEVIDELESSSGVGREPGPPGNDSAESSGPADTLGELREVAPAGAVLTPHAGELARLMKLDRERIEAAPLAAARDAAARWQAVVVLKGRRTVISSPTGRTRVNTTGTPWLGTAGAGDVLAGLIGGLRAAGLDAFDAAAAGAWLHGSAATLVSGGGPFSAGDLVEGVRRVVADLSRSTGAPYAD